MKKQKIEKWLLLEQTGELSPRRLRRLARELEASAEVREFKRDLTVLSGVVLRQDVELPPWTVAGIINRLRGARSPFADFSKVWKPVFALAACLILAAGLFDFHGTRVSSTSVASVSAAGVDVWNDPFEEDLSRLENLIVAISGDSLNVMEM